MKMEILKRELFEHDVLGGVNIYYAPTNGLDRFRFSANKMKASPVPNASLI